MRSVIIFLLLGATKALGDSPNWRVVGGSTAAPGQFPFIFSLRGYSNSHNCGGSFIDKNWAITAAHCVSGANPQSLTLVGGINKLNDTNGVIFKVSEVIVHPNYNAYTIENDLALLKLTTPVEESNLVQIINMESIIIDSPRDCTLIGWGRLSASGPIPNDLQYLNSESVSIDSCKSAWLNIQNVYNSQICTFTKSGEGACYGDSGGPLVAMINDKFVLIGLVSWGQPCAVGRPDVYTRVGSYYSWIRQSIVSFKYQ